MIESHNPEIDVHELMKRVRRIVAGDSGKSEGRNGGRRESSPIEARLPPIPDAPAPPPFAGSGPVDFKKERLDALLQRAREATDDPSVPRAMRGLFRKQGSYNRLLLDAISSLLKTNAQLTKRVHELTLAAQQQNYWLSVAWEQRSAQLEWMRAAEPLLGGMGELHRRITAAEAALEESKLTGEELRGESQEMRADLQEVQSEAATFQTDAAEQIRRIELDGTRSLERIDVLAAGLASHAEHLRNLQQQADAAGEHLRNLQGEMQRTADTINGLREAEERQGEHLRNLQVQADRSTDANSAARETTKAHADHLRALQVQADTAGEHLRNLQVEMTRATDRLRELDALRTSAAKAEADIAHLSNLRQQLARLEERQANDAAFLKAAISIHDTQFRRTIASENEPPADDSAAGSVHDPGLDAFYLSFENRFRGERSDIKERVRFYLPFLKTARAGTAARPVLDLGCGRGEWLELLKENDLVARGVDLNTAMIAQCEARDLDVTHADVLEHLRSLPANSHGAITGFHIIEHLPLTVLLELFAQTLRVLKPGGVAIFESPNCRNLSVGACYFNVDPTHRNPVFPEAAEFMLNNTGFVDVRLEYLSLPDTRPFNGDEHDAPILNDLLFGPQDFGVIGRKPPKRAGRTRGGKKRAE